MANSADPDQLASEEANWSGSTLFVKAGHIRVQQDKGWYSNGGFSDLKGPEIINYTIVKLWKPFYGSNTVLTTRVVKIILPASVAQLDAPSDWRPGGRGFNPRRGQQHSFVEIDHEIFSTVILSLPLIQEGQLSVSGERMCTMLVNRLED